LIIGPKTVESNDFYNTTQFDKSYHHAKSSGNILATRDREASIQGFTLFQSWCYKAKTVIERQKTP